MPIHDFQNLEALTELLNRAWRGDRAAESEFVELVYEHVKQIVRRIRRRFPGVSRLESTEADTHEVFLRVIFKRRGGKRSFSSRGEFVSACFVAARHLLIDRLRRNQIGGIAEPLNGHEPAVNGESPLDQQVALEEVELLRLLVGELQDDDYVLVSLVYFLGMPVLQAAVYLDKPESSCRDQLRRIKRQLGTALSESAGVAKL